MNRVASSRHSLVLGVLLCGVILGRGIPAVASEASPRQRAKPPNVVMLCIDDLNDWVGFLGGHPDAITPRLDALASRGCVFANAHCAVPVCSASRISVMSGIAATTHGSYELGPSYQELPALAAVPTLQRFFQDHGYTTLSGGKVLHHGFTGRLREDIDRDLGNETGPRPPRPISLPDGWSRAWDWGAFPMRDEETADYQLAARAAAVLHEESEKPFFLSLGFFRPHVPLYVPPRWFGLYDEQRLDLPLALATDLDDVPGNFRDINHFAAAPTHDEVVRLGKQRSLTHAYLASVSYVDHCVGVVLDALEASPHAETTLVVVWSDHGFHLGEKQHWAKRTLWEESTRVPLLFAGPGIAEGGVCQEAVSLIDLYPTLTELCDLPTPAHVEGRSLTPQLHDPRTPRREPAITSSYYGNHSVRSRDWRLIVYADGAEELYDHRSDPDEFENLAGEPSHQAVRDELAAWVPKNAAAEFKELSERRAKP